jgi:phosphotransferase system  glucose/maltose/N-acetylglucosamine-specific IIC component
VSRRISILQWPKLWVDPLYEIVDKAGPGLRPVRPNKPLNIAVGIIVGGVAGFVLATLVYALEWRAFRRTSRVLRTPLLQRFRAIVYLLIALVFAVFVGYLLANPLSFSAFVGIPLALFVGGIAAAFIALANLKSETAPRQTEPMTPP